MPLSEVIRRTLQGLGDASDEEVAGYILDAFLIRVHPKQVAAVRKSSRGRRHCRHERRNAGLRGRVGRRE
jgi:hypothetical protein